MQEYLLRIEAVNLDFSIYDTYDISTIRGGSFMLHNAFNGIEKRFNQLNLTELKDIGSAASVGIYSFKVADENVEEIIVNPLLKEILKGIESFATLVWSLQPVNQGESFTKILKSLTAECRWKQYQKASVVLPQEKDCKDFCSLNGILPAAIQERIKEKDRYISQSVFIRKQKGRELRQKIYEELLGENISVTDDLETLSKLKDAGNLDGKIAFIYLDGNRFGKIRDKKCQNAEQYSTFQNKIKNELRNPALKEILESAKQNPSFVTNDNKIRIETLLWGGDEIEWVIPAWQALNVLKLFFETTKKSNQFDGVTLTHSAGVVFCSHNIPILQIRRYAKQLCEIAKEDISKDIYKIGPDADRFAFLNIVSFDYMTGDVGGFLKDYYHPASAKDFVVKAEEIGHFQEYLPSLKKHFPNNKLHDIFNALKTGNNKEVENICERALSLMSEWQRKKAEDVLKAIINNNPNRWFIVGDLIRYVE